MSKKPADRFPNCIEFTGALRDAFGGVMQAPIEGAVTRTPARKWMIVTALAIVVLAAGIFGLARMKQDRGRQTEVTRLEDKRSTTVAERATQSAARKDEVVRKEDINMAVERAAAKTVERASEHGLLKALAKRVNEKDGQVYVRVPAGSFQMGCSPGDPLCQDDDPPMRYGDKSVHCVRISKPFWIGQTLVTVAAYQRFAKAAESELPRPAGMEDYWREPEMPISNIAWEEASAYCLWAGGQLPTEAQWEYAARGGNPAEYYGKPDKIGWYSGDSGSGNSDYRPHTVATKAPNSLGLFDMLGNMQQWCREAPYAYNSAEVADPVGTEEGGEHIMRGGGFQASLRSLRVSFRYRGSGRSSDYGFRCVLPDS
jgi:formylglycine-generating enzyme required for sulfatase activity